MTVAVAILVTPVVTSRTQKGGRTASSRGIRTVSAPSASVTIRSAGRVAHCGDLCVREGCSRTQGRPRVYWEPGPDDPNAGGSHRSRTVRFHVDAVGSDPPIEYRWLHLENTNGERGNLDYFRLDTSMHGLQVGIAFEF